MLMAGVVLFGAVSWSRIGVSQFPDVDFPTINVNFTWEGAAPEIMETEVVDVVEEALTQVEGVTEIRSTSRKGSASITLELQLSRDVDAAVQDVQTKVAQAQQRLPRDLDPPVVSKTNPEDQPIMWIGLSGPYSPQMLSDYSRYRVKERLQTVPGVGEIILGGSLTRSIRIWLQADRLDRYGLSVSDVLSAAKRQHVELPAGVLKTGGREISVRVLGEAFDLSEYENLVVGGTPQAPVHMSDIALVEDGFEDITRYTRVNWEPAQGLGIRKQRGTNALEVAGGVKAALEEIRKTLPEGMALGINFDSTPYIAESVNELRYEIIQAIVLTALVCWLFLRSFSSTLNVLLAIPMSLLGALAVTHALGWTLNTFTLLGLGLAVGIVVDDAILVLENIVRRRERGEDAVTASSRGTREIAFSALAATVAIIAIVIPVVFMQGIVGRFFLQFGVALCVAVAFSYLEAVTLAPARCAQILKNDAERRTRIGAAIDGAFDGLQRVYARALGGALRHPQLTVFLAIALFGASILAFRKLPGEFVPTQDQSRLMVRLTTAVGSDLDESDRVIREAEKIVNAHPMIQRALVNVGGFGGTGANSGMMFLTLPPIDQRPLSQEAITADLRKKLNGIPGLRAVVQDPSQQGFTSRRGFPIEFSLGGSDWQLLAKTAQEMTARMNESGLVVDLDTDYQLGMPELRIEPDRERAADLGVPIEDIASALEALIGGTKIGKFTLQGRRVDVRAQLVKSQRSSPQDVLTLRMRARGGTLIPLSALVKIDERPALQSITRRDRQRAISIFANVAPGHAQNEAIEAVGKLRKDLPTGITLTLGGASSAFGNSMGDLRFAMMLGLLVAYMVLAAQFNSFAHPFTVLSILPLSLAGGAIGLLVMGKTLNLFSMIGFILLMGLAKKNSIVLVDFAARAQEDGMDAREAMLHAAPMRLRPILMTSVATIVAAFPIALGLGPGGEMRAPMAIVIVGGMLVATTLSLLVVPAVYVLIDKGRGGRRGDVAGSPTSVDNAS
jgi:multidrug efflux pump